MTTNLENDVIYTLIENLDFQPACSTRWCIEDPRPAKWRVLTSTNTSICPCGDNLPADLMCDRCKATALAKHGTRVHHTPCGRDRGIYRVLSVEAL